ncbi:potential fungal zinc cluster transcription factor [Pseudozyma hubeiensis SY62]|uniref:Potential fungal zinc cluster transcription factor n=1 Tax=Pseudozyma hubeiensis (strain SY62) TaxID=1305764 RepID=R9P657_PSEHS|nr:potential fungal zinc cluster transcription factor [Pseudozyma hubeiensis SY62]GAC96883.1 potential fungal zinc cluster transcription factor [Pseudozyma hubeiensis SY62]
MEVPRSHLRFRGSAGLCLVGLDPREWDKFKKEEGKTNASKGHVKFRTPKPKKKGQKWRKGPSSLHAHKLNSLLNVPPSFTSLSFLRSLCYRANVITAPQNHPLPNPLASHPPHNVDHTNTSTTTTTNINNRNTLVLHPPTTSRDATHHRPLQPHHLNLAKRALDGAIRPRSYLRHPDVARLAADARVHLPDQLGRDAQGGAPNAFLRESQDDARGAIAEAGRGEEGVRGRRRRRGGVSEASFVGGTAGECGDLFGGGPK